MYTFRSVPRNELEGFQSFTYPYFRALLQGAAVDAAGVGAYLMDRPVGFALGQILPEKRGGELCSVFVAPDHRRCGIGSRLLEDLERELSARCIEFVTTTYATYNRNAAAVERMLQKAGWPAPEPRLLVCTGEWPVVSAATWMRRRDFPPEYEVFPWSELRPEERRHIEDCAARHEWFLAGLNPFWRQERTSAALSLGLRFHGKLAGWSIVHHYDAESAQFVSLFVDPPLQRLGRAVPLLAQSIWAMQDTPMHRIVCEVALDNTPMLHFAKRRLQPYCTSYGLILRAWKPVAVEAAVAMGV
jgi:ribosomal protein S18 acetylase RimI-like enzyme